LEIRAIHREEEIDRGATARSARSAMLRWMFGLSVLVCILAIANLHRRPIDYARADGALDAFRGSSVDDTRYLAIEGEYPTVPLPANQSSSPTEPLEAGKDVRLIPLAPSDQFDKQRAYIMRYNGMMMELLHAKQQHGRDIQRSEPLSAPLFVFTSLLVAAPFYLHLYFVYLLGPYRLDGQRWPLHFWKEDYWEYTRPSMYADGAQFLLMLLWIDIALIVPWGVGVGRMISRHPLP